MSVVVGPNRYPAGSVVAVGDADVGFALIAFGANETHDNTQGDPGNLFRLGDGIYLDDGNRTVTAVLDTRITPAAGSGLGRGRVASGDGDVPPFKLVEFASGQTSRHERHTDQVVTDQLMSVGEFIYNDVDNNQRVSAGDQRLTAVSEGGNNYAAGSVVAAGDSDAQPRPLVAFAANEKHRENVVNGQYDNGEFIYRDVDGNNAVSVGDVRLTAVPPFAAGTVVAAGDADLTQVLVAFAANEAHDTLAGPGGFVAGDGIYRDNDASGGITVADTRITPAAGSGLAPGAVVLANNDVLPRLLVVFTQGESHSDPNQDGFFSNGEPVYNDADGDGKVNAGDTRLTASFGGAAGSVVAAGDPDDGLPLTGFYDFNAINERHSENVMANQRFDNGEFIYNDVDNSRTVTAGDIRLMPVGAFAAGSVVAVGDADLGNPLADWAVDISSTDLSDNDGHGTAVAGVIGAVGNNGINIAGVCWKARIMGLRTGFARSSTIKCLQWIAGQKTAGENIRVVNMSLGSRGYDLATKTNIDNTANTGNGMLFTISAGNDATDNDGDGQPVDTVYRSANANVTAGDTRVTAFGSPGLGLGQGSVVGGADPDVGQALVPFFAIEKYVDANANNQYDPGERVYRDMDGSGSVTVNDVRLGSFSSGGSQYSSGRVAAGDLDIGQNLRAFAANERHIDAASGIPNYFDGNLPDYPATFDLPSIVSVAATDASDNLAVFSNWGRQTVHLGAPGQAILTLRPVAQGGGVQYINGTSFSAPLVAGILAQSWSRPANLNDTPSLTKNLLLSGYNGEVLGFAAPHGIDHRYGIRNTVSSGGNNHDGRARMAMGDEFGDAPDAPYPTKLTSWGGRHEDMGEEWLGRDPALPPAWVYDLPQPPPPPTGATPEFDATDSFLWPPDPDGVQNLVNLDAADDGVMLLGPFQFSKPGAPRQATLRVFINTANNDVVDGAGGRYAFPGYNVLGLSTNVPGNGVNGPYDNRNVWVNAWFDWNRNGSFEDPGEHVFMLGCNPRAFVPAHGGVYYVTFNMPLAPTNAQPGQPIYARFRLDYGENAGQTFSVLAPVLPHNVGPSPAGQVKFWDDSGGLPNGAPFANRWESIPVNPLANPALYESKGLARYGEVEDYLVSAGFPDQIHLYGPNPNNITLNVAQTLTAMVENNAVGLPGQTVAFSVSLGGIQFTSGTLGGGGATSSVVTDGYGSAAVNFVGTNAGPALIQATETSSGLTAFQFLQVLTNQTMVIGMPVNRSVTVQLAVTPGDTYDIERSTDLVHWETLATLVGPDQGPTRGLILFTDTTAPLDHAFYRAHRQ
jgi:hypothetical protein